MKYIKKYNSYKANENVIDSIAILGILLNLLKIILSFKIGSKNDVSVDYIYQSELKKISGYDVEVIKFKDKKGIAFASSTKIFYNEKLLNILTYDEIISVLLHEFSHVNSLDIIKRYVLKMFKYIPIMILDSWLLYFILPVISKILYLGPYIRYSEYNSDSFAKKYGYGKELSTALIKIEKEYGFDDSEYNSNRLYKIVKKIFDIFDTHPKLLDRIKRLYDNENPQEFISKIEAEILKKNEK